MILEGTETEIREKFKNHEYDWKNPELYKVLPLNILKEFYEEVREYIAPKSGHYMDNAHPFSMTVLDQVEQRKITIEDFSWLKDHIWLESLYQWNLYSEEEHEKFIEMNEYVRFEIFFIYQVVSPNFIKRHIVDIVENLKNEPDVFQFENQIKSNNFLSEKEKEKLIETYRTYSELI